MTPEQRRAVEEFRALRGVEPFGPFVPLLDSPELMTRVSALGEYLRYRSALPPILSELAILLTAARCRQSYEWNIHEPIARLAGVSEGVIAAIRDGVSPPGLPEDQQALYDLCVELDEHLRVSPPTLARASRALGRRGVVDAIAICGYYSLLAMVLNTYPPDE
jgi:4-carboxymuconolactone decarboxylase